jgi:ATP-dependent Clp protease ATP-binding subunit ClpA
VRVLVEGEGADRKLGFEYFPAEPKSKGKDKSDDDDDEADDEDAEAPALVEATPRKALSGPKEKKDKPPRSGAVPIVPRRKDE